MPRTRQVPRRGSTSARREPYTAPEAVEVVRLASEEQESGNNPFEALLRQESVASVPVMENFALPSSAFQCADDVLTMHVSKEMFQSI